MTEEKKRGPMMTKQKTRHERRAEPPKLAPLDPASFVLGAGAGMALLALTLIVIVEFHKYQERQGMLEASKERANILAGELFIDNMQTYRHRPEAKPMPSPTYDPCADLMAEKTAI